MQSWFLTFHIRVTTTHFSSEKEPYYKVGSKHYKNPTSYSAGVRLPVSPIQKRAHNNSTNGRWLCL